MKISARNQIKGMITVISEGAVNAVVAVSVGNGVMKSDITMEAVRELGLAVGKEATLVIKASDVLVASGHAPLTNLSARNQLPGKITKVTEGAVNGHVSIDVGGRVVMASITNEAIRELGLAVGADAVAIIKSTDVLIGVD